MNKKWLVNNEWEVNKKWTKNEILFTILLPKKLAPQKLDCLFTISFIAHFGEGSRFIYPLQIASQPCIEPYPIHLYVFVCSICILLPFFSDRLTYYFLKRFWQFSVSNVEDDWWWVLSYKVAAEPKDVSKAICRSCWATTFSLEIGS